MKLFRKKKRIESTTTIFDLELEMANLMDLFVMWKRPSEVPMPIRVSLSRLDAMIRALAEKGNE